MINASKHSDKNNPQIKEFHEFPCLDVKLIFPSTQKLCKKKRRKSLIDSKLLKKHEACIVTDLQ